LYDGLFIYLSQPSSPFDLGPRRRCAPQSAAELTQAMAGRLCEMADMAKCALRVVKNLGRTSAVAFCAVCGRSTLIWRMGDRQDDEANLQQQTVWWSASRDYEGRSVSEACLRGLFLFLDTLPLTWPQGGPNAILQSSAGSLV
jgi:hypothetical protein